MRKTMFVANWKTYKTNTGEVRDFLNEFPNYSAHFDPNHEIILCPSFVHLEAAHTMIPPNVILGAQDCSAYGAGAYCGETSAAQLATYGVKYCILGHVD